MRSFHPSDTYYWSKNITVLKLPYTTNITKNVIRNYILHVVYNLLESTGSAEALGNGNKKLVNE